jgi:putative acetyltransferase
VDEVSIRAARDTDVDGLIALVGGCFAEYAGCVLDVDGEIPELRHIASAYADWNGEFWVAELGSAVVGSIGWTPVERGAGAELKKLYVARAARRLGLGARLCALVESAAQHQGAAFVELWSDTRFADAHRLYQKRGYVRSPGTRELHDLSNTTEYHFRLELSRV